MNYFLFYLCNNLFSAELFYAYAHVFQGQRICLIKEPPSNWFGFLFNLKGIISFKKASISYILLRLINDFGLIENTGYLNGVPYWGTYSGGRQN